MEALKQRVIDGSKINGETVQDIIKELKGHIRAMPFKDSKGTVPLKKFKGNVETYGLMGDDVSAVDRVELGRGSETLWTKTKNQTTFTAVSGHCDLHYVRDGAKTIHKLKPGYPKRVKDKTPFALSSNGTGCRIFLIMEG